MDGINRNRQLHIILSLSGWYRSVGYILSYDSVDGVVMIKSVPGGGGGGSALTSGAVGRPAVGGGGPTDRPAAVSFEARLGASPVKFFGWYRVVV